jgi:hypothetical protein
MLMKRSFLVVVLVGALTTGSFLRSNRAQETKMSETEDGIKLLATVTKEEFRVGDPILLKLVLKNDSKEELRLVSTGLKDYKLDVRDESGKISPLTPTGETAKRSESVAISKGRLTFKPGEEHDEGEISVTDRFKLTAPGKYVIIARRPGLSTDGKPTTIESNKVTVTIK